MSNSPDTISNQMMSLSDCFIQLKSKFDNINTVKYIVYIYVQYIK